MSATTLPDSQLLLLGQTIEEEMSESETEKHSLESEDRPGLAVSDETKWPGRQVNKWDMQVMQCLSNSCRSEQVKICILSEQWGDFVDIILAWSFLKIYLY